MEHLYKCFAIKSADDAGTISGYFSTYDRIPDSYGDVIAKGAFAEAIKKREESGHPYPLCWGHDLNQIIGAVDSIADDEHGPLMTAHFFDTPLAQEKRELVKSGVVYQFSFAYDVRESGLITLEDGTKANELRKVDLIEISIVANPANPRAEVTSIKSEAETVETKETEAEVKSGRRNRKSDEDIIKQIIALAESLLDEETDGTEESADPVEEEPKAKPEIEGEEPKAINTGAKNQLLSYIKSMEEKK